MKKSMKTLNIAVVLSLVIVMALSGCVNTGNVVQGVADAVDKFKDALDLTGRGNVTGEIGKNYKTKWFVFNINSIDFVDEYAGYIPEDGNTLVDVVITETSIFGEVIPMGTFDFYMDSSDFYDYIWSIDSLDDEVMPAEFELNPDETVNYHMIFEIPADTTDLALMYTEFTDDGSDEGQEGDTFTIKIK